MKVVSVEINNYGPFKGRHVFPLSDRGLVLILGDNRDEPRMNNNGSGKTSMFDSLKWCWYGVVPKCDHVDSVVFDGADEPAEVISNLLDDDGTPIRIRRYRKVGGPSEVELHVGDRELTALDARETQALIERVLGMDVDVFHAVMYYAQESKFNFADATDAQRMEIVTKILQLGDIDAYLEQAKAKLKEQQDACIEARRVLSGIEGELSQLNPAVYEQNAVQWDEERAHALREGTRQLNEHLTNIETWRKTLQYEERIRTNLMVLEQAGTAVLDLSALDTAITQARNEHARAHNALATIKAEGQMLRQRRDKLAAKEAGDCPECGQPVSAEHLAREIAVLDGKLEELRSRWTAAEQEVRVLEGNARAAEQQKEEQRRLHYEADKVNAQRLQEAREQLRTVDEAKRYVAQAEQHVAHLRQTMAATQQKPNPWRTKQAEVAQRHTQLMQEAASGRAMIAASELEQRYLQFWVDGFGPSGLKNYILDSRLQEMTDAANEWVRLLTGGTIWVRFESQSMGRSTKKLSNKTKIRVFRYNPDGTVTERNYRSWSGGEKRRVSWAVDFGLSRLVAARATKRYDVLILDEVFKHVDRAGGEAVVEMLHKLIEEKSSIFVVEQDSDFQSHFEQRTVVRKQNGCSGIIEESENVEGVSSDRQETPQPKRREAQPKGKAKDRAVSAGTPRRKKRPTRRAGVS